MSLYLISFPDGAMDHLSPEELARASVESRAVCDAAEAAGVWVTGGGIVTPEFTGVAVDGTATRATGADGTFTGGLAVLDVASYDEALAWAARIAAACRCTQEVRELA
jgi:hypothetical protein